MTCGTDLFLRLYALSLRAGNEIFIFKNFYATFARMSIIQRNLVTLIRKMKNQALKKQEQKSKFAPAGW